LDEAAAIEPVLVEPADGDHVGHIDVLHEVDAALGDRDHVVEARHVDRRARRHVAIEVDGAGNPAHQPVGVDVLAAEDRAHAHDFLLEIERLKIVRDGHQVGFGGSL
jgi:hypothetical protein